jgi:hypothetical protein
MATARCHLQTRSRFWEHDPLGGLNFVGTDTRADRVWNTSSQQPATRSAAEQQLHPPYELRLPHPHGSSGEDVVRDHWCRSSYAPSCTIVTCDANALTRPMHDRILAGFEPATGGFVSPALSRPRTKTRPHRVRSPGPDRQLSRTAVHGPPMPPLCASAFGRKCISVASEVDARGAPVCVPCGPWDRAPCRCAAVREDAVPSTRWGRLDLNQRHFGPGGLRGAFMCSPRPRRPRRPANGGAGPM